MAHTRCAVTSLLVLLLVALGAVPQRRVEDLEIANLIKFGQTIRWPAGVPARGARFAICILGLDTFGAAFDRAAEHQQFAGHLGVVRRVATPEQAAACQVVFVSRSEEVRVASILEAVRGLPILMVSEIPGFLLIGGTIGFVVTDDHVRFDVSVAAADAAGLQVPGELVQAARTVRR